MPIDLSALSTAIGLLLLAAGLFTVFAIFFHRWVNRLVNRLARVDYLRPFIRALTSVRLLVDLVGFGLIALGAVLVALHFLGINIAPALGTLREIGLAVGDWLRTHGLRIFITLVAASLGALFLRRRLPPLMEGLLTRGKEGVALEEASQRAHTLAGVLSGAGVAIAFGLAFFIVLAELGINIGPALVGLGVAGIAVGFAAQHLVRDIINGLLILLDNQFTKGDVVRIAGTAGLVEDFNLRRTVLRDLDGIVHFIPNGEISTVSNFTKEWSRVNLDIQVAYKEDLDRVISVINQVGKEMAEDPYFRDLLLETPYVLRVNDFKDSGVEIKILAMTKPLRQWDVAGELRRRLKKRFDQEGIEIPFPHITLYWGKDAHPLRSVLGDLERLGSLSSQPPPSPPGDTGPTGER